jgi:murein DD-endopeptidase MepM/ murein hydrolase activator NlpD
MNLGALRVGLVVFALVWASVAVPQSHSNRTTGAKKTQKKSVAALQGDLGAIRKKKSVIRRELNQTKAATRVVKTDILIVDQRLDRLRSEVEDTERDLSISVSRQRELAKDVKEATAQVEVLRNRVRMRLKAIYLQGDQQVISALVGAKTVGELVSRASMMEAIAKQDRELFRDYETLSKRLKSKKLAQDAQVVQTRRLQEFQVSKKQELAEAREEKADKLNALRLKQADLQAALRDFEQDEAGVRAQIRAYLERQKRPGAIVVVPSGGGLMHPVPGRITSGFGMRYHPLFHTRRNHTGVDFGARMGTPIAAAADGVVISTGYGRAYGNRVVIDHGGGLATMYGHCSAVYVGAGQRVKKGQRIAAVGSTGWSTGPHLHFEVWVNGTPVNPMSRL